MVRQIKCSGFLQEYDNGLVTSYFCGQKSCPICNSFRSRKFLRKYKATIDSKLFKYHMVLSIRNPNEKELKNKINSMYNFWNQSSIKRNKRYKELNKIILLIRSFESTFNYFQKSFNIHFHLLLGGNNREDVIEYGELLINYWLKYFGDEADRKAQYLEETKKSILENFKYLVKIDDVKKFEIPMFYQLLKATKHKNLFLAKNIIKGELVIEEDLMPRINTENSIIIERHHYNRKIENWINPETGELFINDYKLNNYKKDLEELNRLRELKKYFNFNKLPTYNQQKEYYQFNLF